MLQASAACSIFPHPHFPHWQVERRERERAALARELEGIEASRSSEAEKSSARQASRERELSLQAQLAALRRAQREQGEQVGCGLWVVGCSWRSPCAAARAAAADGFPPRRPQAEERARSASEAKARG